ncbi:UDP-N-acetylglucosamine 2-epimerase [Ignicoccus hospitalis KIN4/I]|uniref:UDP-N-acetylglucosamine 2-epimerase n=1 Tax=Ignicoccus hospitalis (strain KIN4/I / DSM 18386 / JCM 14125) TaxID=453591 RepID=A8AA53_IGNH4|nr:UDP-N-acetylglucosamine 2-epimerase [Ignicoccus hospitalis KIN4/I]
MIAVVVGTRPEIIKMAPVVLELESRGIDYTFVHTGQHYDYEMSKIFIEELGLPEPHFSFELKGSTPGEQIGEMIIHLDKISQERKPKVVAVQGDTNSMVAAAIAALKVGAEVAHVEAGLRSYDWRMPEEHNRRMIDHVSKYLFAPTEDAKRNLEEEMVYGEIYVTGNTVIDALDRYMGLAEERSKEVLEKVPFDEFGVVTFHRAENVDNPQTLKDFVRILERSPIPLVYPVHPRTRKRLLEFGLWDRVKRIPHLMITEPLGYLEFIGLLKNSKIVLSDSGGLQEEVTHPKIRKRIIVLRTSTERPEAIKSGFAYVVGTNPVVVLATLERALNEGAPLPEASPFGDGKAGKRIVDVLERVGS